jgi:hypothetical protein
MNEKQTPEKGVCVCVKPVSSGVLMKFLGIDMLFEPQRRYIFKPNGGSGKK